MPRQFGKTDVSATWTCGQCPHKHMPGSPCPPTDTWLVRRAPARALGTVWIKRRMPDGQWPPDRRAPRDDSFAWWVRAHCGHDRGARQFAFYHEKDADEYGHLFRADPCHYTRCRGR